MTATAASDAGEGSTPRTVSLFLLKKTESQAARNWDVFYKKNETRFFKDRHWTEREFGSDLGGGSGGASGSGSTPGVSAGAQADADDADAEASRELERLLLEGVAASAASGSGGGGGKGKGRQRDSVILEVGCGVGNMLYPLLERYPNLKAHACDFSPRAVALVRQHPLYTPERVNAFVYDLTNETPPTLTDIVTAGASAAASGSEAGSASADAGASNSADAAALSIPHASVPPPPTTISMIFVLSAVPPQHHERVLRSLAECLRVSAEVGARDAAEDADAAAGAGASSDALRSPRPTLLFRDYAAGDLAQERFDSKDSALPSYHEPARLAADSLYYRRGVDNTIAYFFAPDELARLADAAGLQGEVRVVERNVVNRKTEVTMRRRFVQARWHLKEDVA